jgi:regulator of protease activity HflC (stomatin/prohibitin superfamily)
MSKSNIIRIQETEPPGWISMPWWLGVFVTLFFLGLTFSSVFLAFSMAMFMGSSVIPVVLLSIISVTALVMCAKSFRVVDTNHCMNMTFFGVYKGTERHEGLRWIFPIGVGTETYNLAILNMSTNPIKVNDKSGSPIEIAGTVVWRIMDPAKFQFAVNGATRFIGNQLEIALRQTAGAYRYDTLDIQGEDSEPEITLRGNVEAVTARLKQEIEKHCDGIGVEIMDFRLTHLAYAPEIARDMLRRQQAEAVLSARSTIAHGAVSIIQDVVGKMESKVALNERERAALVSNLLVVMVGDSGAQPVVPLAKISEDKG